MGSTLSKSRLHYQIEISPRSREKSLRRNGPDVRKFLAFIRAELRDRWYKNAFLRDFENGRGRFYRASAIRLGYKSL
jgi:hypothetical protein